MGGAGHRRREGRVSEHTIQLRGLVEEAAFLFGHARTMENEQRLKLAWEDYHEALRSDWLHNLIANDSAA